MSHDGAERPRDFEPIEDPVEAARLLREGCRTVASVMLWTKNQETVLRTNLLLYKEKEKRLHVATPKGTQPEQLMDRLAREGQRECFFSASLQHAVLFFKARFRGFETGDLEFEAPAALYKVQRRQDLRFPIPDGVTLKVEFQDPLFPETRMTRKVLDISAGGLAFLVNDDEAPTFQIGLKVNDLVFALQSRKFSVQCEVRHTKPLPANSRQKGVKVGVQFLNLRPGDTQTIANYVFEESRKYFSKFL